MNLYLYPQVQVKCTNRFDLDTKTYKYKVLIAGIDFTTGFFPELFKTNMKKQMLFFSVLFMKKIFFSKKKHSW